MVFCDNVQCNTKCDLLIQYDMKMVQCDKIVVNDAIELTMLSKVTPLL